MNALAKNLIAEAKKLTPVERIELIDEVLATLEPDQAEVDRLWVIEVNDRLEAFKRGEITARDAREVLAELRRK